MSEQIDEWVLMKRGLFYRPNGAGYTSNEEQAWVLTESEAKKHVYPHDVPVTMHRRNRSSKDEQLAALRVQVVTLTAERDYWQECAERERNQRQKEVGAQEYRCNTVSYIFDKCATYGRKFDEQRAELKSLAAERDKLRVERDAEFMRLRAAERMAKAVDDAVERKVIDARSAIADARLNFGDPFKYSMNDAATVRTDDKEPT